MINDTSLKNIKPSSLESFLHVIDRKGGKKDVTQCVE